jgi:hypothetical protein
VLESAAFRSCTPTAVASPATAAVLLLYCCCTAAVLLLYCCCTAAAAVCRCAWVSC